MYYPPVYTWECLQIHQAVSLVTHQSLKIARNIKIKNKKINLNNPSRAREHDFSAEFSDQLQDPTNPVFFFLSAPCFFDLLINIPFLISEKGDSGARGAQGPQVEDDPSYLQPSEFKSV